MALQIPCYNEGRMDAWKKRYPALAYRDFRLQWAGQFVSNAGTQMQLVSINWHIYILTHSAYSLGIIGITRFVPIALLALFAGLATDRFNRKKVLIATESMLTLMAFILALATLTHTVTPFIIYAVSFVSAALTAFELPARQSLIPNLVEKEHIHNAVNLSNIAYNLSSILGPAISGLLIASLGIASAYIFNAISYLVMITTLLYISHTGAIAGARAEVSLLSLKEGVRFVFSKTMIWSTMLLDFFVTFFGEANVLMPIFANDVLKVGARGLGFLYAAPFAGAMLGGFIIANAGKIRQQGKVLIISVTGYAAATIAFGISHVFALSLFALAVMGLGDGVSSILRSTIRQMITPDYIRGRMSGINMLFFMGGPQLGEFEAGFVAGLIGAPLSVVAGGVGTLLVIGIMAITLPVMRNYQAD